MSEAKDRENIDCYCSQKSPQNQLEIPSMVKLVELRRLNKDSPLNTFQGTFIFTFSIRKVLVMLRAMRVPCTREKRQKTTT